MASPPPPSPAAIKLFADANHMSTEQARQYLESQRSAATSGNTFVPFALQGAADQGTLWLGSQAAGPEGLPSARPNGTKQTTLTYNGRKINVTTPDYGSDYKIEIHSSWGHTPSEEELQKAKDHPSSLTLTVMVKDANGKVVDHYELADEEKRIILGNPKQDYISGKGDPLINVEMDPYNPVQPSAADIAGRALYGGLHGTNSPQSDQTAMIEDELKKLYSLAENDPAKMRGYKHQLWLAGYYGQGTKLEEVNMNTITNEDVSAFGSLMAGAARYYAAGKKITWQSLLEQQASDPSVKAKEGEQPIALTDPAAITLSANETATKILGRAPTPKDVATLISLIHSQQTVTGKALQGTAGGTVIQPDPAAQIEQFLRSQHPDEAMAVDWGSAAQQWDQLLASTSPQPRTVSANG